MSQSRLTLNINCSYVQDWNKTLEFLRKLDPVAVIAVIDNLRNRNRIDAIKQALPNAKITARCIIVVDENGQKKEFDGGMHLQPQAAGDTNRYIISPVNFIDTWGELGRGGLRLAYLNEPQATHASQENIGRLVQHMIETIAYANQTNTELELGGFGAGHPTILPSGQIDARLDDVLILLSKNRQHTLSIHLYSPIDTYKVIDAILARYKVLGLPPCRIVVSEFGFDTAGNGDPLNGYKSRNISGEQFGDWCVDKIKNLYQPYIADGILEYVAVFGWGYAASFPNFDVETDTGWQGTILAAKDAGKLTINTRAATPIPPIPTPQYPAPLLTVGQRYTIVTPGAIRNVRSAPTLGTTEFVGKLSDGAIITALEVKPVGIDWWVKLETAEGVVGWVSCDGDRVHYKAVQPPPVVITPPAAPYLEVTPAYAAKMASAQRALAAARLSHNVSLKAQIAALEAEIESNILLAQDELSIAQTWDDIAEQTTLTPAA